jgi:hypothetical protein
MGARPREESRAQASTRARATRSRLRGLLHADKEKEERQKGA